MARGPDIQRGLDLIRAQPELMPEQAGERLRRVYDEVRETLRVPFVNFIFRTLANHPGYLLDEWDRLRPWARSIGFERGADTLRASALLDPEAAGSGTDWSALGDLGRIRPFTESIHYVLPKLLLLAAAMDERLGNGLSGADASGAELAGQNEIPAGVAPGTVSIPMLDPEQATGRARDLFDRIKERHGHPGVASYYRALGHWPEFLAAAWERVEVSLGTPARRERKQAVLCKAAELVVEGAPRTAEDAFHASGGAEAADLRAILAVFRFRLIPDLLLDVALIRAMLDGAQPARVSRFSAAQKPA